MSSPGEAVRAGSRRAGARAVRRLARVVGFTRSAVSHRRRPVPAGGAGPAEAPVKACLVGVGRSPGPADHAARWPSPHDRSGGCPDLVAVLIAREAGFDAVTVCGYHVDPELGVTAVVGPRVLNDQQHAQFTRAFFASSLRAPVPVTMPVARQLVIDAVERARAVGFEPAPGFGPARHLLGPPTRSRRSRVVSSGAPDPVAGGTAPRVRHALDLASSSVVGRIDLFDRNDPDQKDRGAPVGVSARPAV